MNQWLIIGTLMILGNSIMLWFIRLAVIWNICAAYHVSQVLLATKLYHIQIKFLLAATALSLRMKWKTWEMINMNNKIRVTLIWIKAISRMNLVMNNIVLNSLLICKNMSNRWWCSKWKKTKKELTMMVSNNMVKRKILIL